MSLFSRLFGGGRAGRLRAIGFSTTALRQIEEARERSEEQAEEHRSERDRRRRTNEVLEARRAESDAVLSDNARTLLATQGLKGEELATVMNEKDFIKFGRQIKALKTQQGARANLPKLVETLYAQAVSRGSENKLASPYAAPLPAPKVKTEPQETKGFFARMQDELTGRGQVDKARAERAAEEARTAELSQPEPFEAVPGKIDPLPRASDVKISTQNKRDLSNFFFAAGKIKDFDKEFRIGGEGDNITYFFTDPQNEAIRVNNIPGVEEFYAEYRSKYRTASTAGRDAATIAKFFAERNKGGEVDIRDYRFNYEEVKRVVDGKYGGDPNKFVKAINSGQAAKDLGPAKPKPPTPKKPPKVTSISVEQAKEMDEQKQKFSVVTPIPEGYKAVYQDEEGKLFGVPEDS